MSRSRDTLTPEETVLVGLTSSKPYSIILSIAVHSMPDHRRGINLSCIILNGVPKVQPSAADVWQVRPGTGALRANTQADVWRQCHAETDPCGQSRLDFDWGESKISPEMA
jgi:hypothetical protein